MSEDEANAFILAVGEQSAWVSDAISKAMFHAPRITKQDILDNPAP